MSQTSEEDTQQFPKRNAIFTNNKPIDPNYDPEVARQRVLDYLGFEPPDRTCGFQVLVALYVRKEEEQRYKREDGTLSEILLPQQKVAQDRYISCTGMVIQMGDDAYQGPRFYYSGPWCRVGDWVTLPRHEGTQFDYKGRPMFYINDDKIVNVISDPSLVKRGQSV